jgi:hypothetical protein
MRTMGRWGGAGRELWSGEGAGVSGGSPPSLESNPLLWLPIGPRRHQGSSGAPEAGG